MKVDEPELCSGDESDSVEAMLEDARRLSANGVDRLVSGRKRTLFHFSIGGTTILEVRRRDRVRK